MTAATRVRRVRGQRGWGLKRHFLSLLLAARVHMPACWFCVRCLPCPVCHEAAASPLLLLHGPPEPPAGQLGKLEAQLALAKAADVERLAVQAARSCGLHLPGQLGRGGAAQQEAEPSSEQSAEAATASPAAGAAAAAGGCASGAQGGDAAAQLAAVVEARILGAKALRERLAEVQAGIEKVAQAAARREAAAAARAAGEAGSTGPQTEAAGSKLAAEQPAPAGAAQKQSGRKRKEQQEDELLADGGQARAVEEGEPVGPGSSDEGEGEGEGEDGEAARERRRQRRERERPADEDLDDVATCALAKLLGTRGKPGSAAAGGRGEVESESEEDSGVWHSGSDDEQLLLGSDGEQGAAAAWRGRADSGVDGGSGEETGGSDAEAGGGSSSEGEEDWPAPLAAHAAAAAGQQRSRQTAGTAVQELASGGRQQDVPHPQQQGKRQKAKQAVEGKQGKLPQPKKVQKPKNRLGQRARRLLAAQQYGQNARHLQLEREQQVEQQGAAALQPQQKQQQGSGAGGSAEALHPSWAAKQAQKQKLAISIFAGPSAAKKVVFDDDGEAKRTGSSSGGQPANASRHPPAAGGSSSGLGASRKPHASGDGSRGTAAGKPAARPRRAEQPLHPSWEAKKRLQEQQKRMILPAQGKKIVFGEDD